MSTFVYDEDKKQQHTRQHRLPYEDLDLVRLYLYTFHLTDFRMGITNIIIDMLRRYTMYFLKNKYGVDINIFGNLSRDMFYLDIYIERPSRSLRYKYVDAHIYDDGTVYLDGYIDIEEIRNIIRDLGSISYGMALALIESLSNDPRCVNSRCIEYIDNLQKNLSHITYFPVPDLKAYEFVKDLINNGGIPFESFIDVSKSIYKKLKKLHKIVISNDLDSVLNRIDCCYIDENISSGIDIKRDSFRIIFKLGSIYDSIIFEFDIYHSEPKIHITIGRIRYVKNIKYVYNLIRNWYDYTIKTIKDSINMLENLEYFNQVDLDTLKKYLETWLKIISMYRNDIEKNKKF